MSDLFRSNSEQSLERQGTVLRCAFDYTACDVAQRSRQRPVALCHQISKEKKVLLIR
jgi:hypothetical protein